jgi:DNA-binding MarR family transcriptional regulator
MIEGLTPTQFSALIKLLQYGPTSQNPLGRTTSMDVATIKGVIDRLSARGLTKIHPDPQDGRRAVASPTPMGVEVITKARPRAFAVSSANLAPP